MVESFADRRRSFQLATIAGMTSVVEHHLLVEARHTPHMRSPTSAMPGFDLQGLDNQRLARNLVIPLFTS